jgi:hypothetical protein
MAHRSERLVMIAVASTEVEANIFRDVLAQEGISTFVKSADPLASIGATPIIGGLQVYVQAGDEKRARWVLGEAAPGAP